MADITLTQVVDAIVEFCNEAGDRGDRMTGEQIEDTILARWPDASPILDLAFVRAAAQLKEEAERHLRESKALEILHRELEEIQRETGLGVTGETPVIEFVAAAAATGNERALRLLERLR